MNIDSILKFFKDNPERVNFEPESIFLLLKKYKLDKQINFDLLLECYLAVKSCIVSNIAWKKHSVFENVVDAINLNPIDIDNYTMPEIIDIKNAMEEMKKIRDIEFSEEIYKYISAIAINEGFCFLPGILSGANQFLPDQEMVKKLQYLYDRLKYQNLQDIEFGESATDIQLAKILIL